jgi:hypothetical protein
VVFKYASKAFLIVIICFDIQFQIEKIDLKDPTLSFDFSFSVGQCAEETESLFSNTFKWTLNNS